MNRKLLPLIIVCAVSIAVSAGKGHDPEPNVNYAKSWDAAVEEAKLLNVPIVAHSHGFNWGPCWGMHRSVLQNKKYMKFADKSTVEVISVSSVPKPNSGDKRVATYKGKDGIEYMVEWPGLTYDQLRNAKAGGYNRSGKIPYVAIVNPHTGEEFAGFNGGSAGKIMDIVAELQKEMKKEHGKGVKRSTLRKLDKEKRKIAALLAKNKVSDAMKKYSAMAKKAAKSEALQNYIKDSMDGILKVADRGLSKAEGLIEQGDLKGAGKIVKPLVRALKDTPLAERAADLEAKTKAQAE